MLKMAKQWGRQMKSLENVGKLSDEAIRTHYVLSKIYAKITVVNFFKEGKSDLCF